MLDPPARAAENSPERGDAAPDAIPIARPISAECRSIPVLPSPSRPADEFLLLGTRRGASVVDMVVLIGGFLVADVAIGTLLMLLFERWTGTRIAAAGEPDPHLMASIIEPMIYLRATVAVGLVSVLLLVRGQSLRSVGMTRATMWINVPLGMVAVLVAVALMFATMLLANMFWPGATDEFEKNAELLRELIPRLSPLRYALLALTVAYYEELVFRGFLLTRIRRLTGSWTAGILISTALFTALHAFDQVPFAMMSIAILSLVFSLVTVWRRSLVPAIVGHWLFDYPQFLWLHSQ